MKLLMSDLDGTLFDTRKVNYLAYQDAISPYGYNMDYDYYCNFCNGIHYLNFLPQITTTDQEVLSEMHSRKKNAYRKYLDSARINKPLVDLIRIVKTECKIALVTTASEENTYDILQKFDIEELFDLILTHEQVKHSKPNPEGYLKALEYFGIKPLDAVIFEDSDVGIEAALKSGVQYFIVEGYN